MFTKAGTSNKTIMIPMNHLLMDTVEILTHYKDGLVTFDQLDAWSAVRLQEAIDRMAIMDFIESADLGEDAMTEQEFKDLLFKLPACKRLLGDPQEAGR
jgi:hypothetical protein